jgi:hypothetical protein
MANEWQKAGPNHVPSYITSGIPFISSSILNEAPSGATTVSFSFPYVTKFFQVESLGGNLKFGFSDLGTLGTVTDNSIKVANNSKSEIYDIRCKEIYLTGDGGTATFKIIAGLTTIPSSNFPALTGSIDGVESFGGIG